MGWSPIFTHGQLKNREKEIERTMSVFSQFIQERAGTTLPDEIIVEGLYGVGDKLVVTKAGMVAEKVWSYSVEPSNFIYKEVDPKNLGQLRDIVKSFKLVPGHFAEVKEKITKALEEAKIRATRQAYRAEIVLKALEALDDSAAVPDLIDEIELGYTLNGERLLIGPRGLIEETAEVSAGVEDDELIIDTALVEKYNLSAEKLRQLKEAIER